MRSLFSKILVYAGILLLLWLGLKYLLPLFLPFLLGAGLALLAEPVVSFFCRRFRMPRGAAAGIGVAMAFCFLALLLILLAALAVKELGALAGVLPDLGSMVKSGISALSGWLQGLAMMVPGGIGDYLREQIEAFFSGGSALLDKAVGFVLNLAGGVLSQVPDGALGLGTAIVSSFMISAELPRIREKLAQLVPKERMRPVFEGARRIRVALVGWIQAQVKLAGVTWGILTAGFLLLRVSYGPLWALLVALVDAFPVLGTGTVLIPWALICLLQGDTARGIGLLGVYAAATLVRSMLEPKFVGRHLGLDPLVTLFALYAGYKVWGLGGMILAPMIAVTVVQVLPQKRADGEEKL